MITKFNGVKELSIFDRFQIDYNLPKNKKPSLLNDYDGDTETSVLTVGWATGSDNFSVGVSDGNAIVGIINPSTSELLRKFFFFWLPTKKFVKPKHEISIFDFFKGVEKNMTKIENIAEISNYYENALTKAKKFGQTALQEKISDLIGVVKNEIILCDDFYFVTEKQVIDLFEQTESSKNLKLTWVSNFNRIIPDNILEAKLLADEKMVFDNYVVLHYDPNNDGEQLTKEEIEKKKDPILFGVFKNSRKLYYIGDWKDEYCDLTLDEMFNILGDTVGEVNNDSVKTFIDNIKV